MHLCTNLMIIKVEHNSTIMHRLLERLPPTPPGQTIGVFPPVIHRPFEPTPVPHPSIARLSEFALNVDGMLLHPISCLALPVDHPDTFERLNPRERVDIYIHS